MITLKLGYAFGEGTKLTEVLKSESSLQIEATTMRELVEELHELYPGSKQVFDYHHMSEGPAPAWMIRVNGKPLTSFQAIREVRFQNGDVVHITTVVCEIFMGVIEAGLRAKETSCPKPRRR